VEAATARFTSTAVATSQHPLDNVAELCSADADVAFVFYDCILVLSSLNSYAYKLFPVVFNI
jgi:hypothetical protein